jgi:WD40 repeat protein
LTSIGTEDITPRQWYKGLCAQLWLGFDLGDYQAFQAWWSSQSGNAPQHFLMACLRKVVESYPQQSVAIFVDEIDSVLALNFPIDDFFALIRYTYNQRAVEPEWQRLTFALFGVAKPSDLIRDRNRTPFNIGQAITLEGFSLKEAQPLAAKLGLPADQAQAVLAAILYWTAGQPFLTQKLCRLVWQHLQVQGIPSFAPAAAPTWVKGLVQQQVIHNWEAQDDPEHLRTIRDLILRNEQRAGLGLCQKILSQQCIPYSGNEEQTELLLSGLVSLHQGQLQIKNRIYYTLFNVDWVAQNLAALRPYSALLQQWMASGKGDDSYLRGQALTDAQAWQQHKSLSELDYQYLRASEAAHQQEIQQRLETAQLQAENARLRQEQEVSRLKTVLLVVALGLSALTWYQYQRAKANEVGALAASSQGLFASNQQLDAVVAAVKAKRGLQQLVRPAGEIQKQVDQVLNQAVFGSNEFNRLTRHEGGVLTVDISPDGNTIVTGSNDKTVRLWSKDGTLLQTLPHQGTVHRVVFSPTGDRVITSSLDGTLQVWSINGQKRLHIQAHGQPIWGVAVSPDGKLIASASGDRTIKLWHADGTPVATLPVTNTAWSVAFSPDGTQIAGAILDGTIQRWTLEGQPLPSIQAHQAEVWDLVYCGESNRLVSVSSDRTIKVWDSDGALLHTLQPPESSAQLGVDCSDKDGFIAASSKNNTVSIWQSNGDFIRTLKGHRAVVRDIALAPDGTLAASASDDGTVKLWQRNSYLLRSLEGHQDTVWSIAVSPDSETVASLAAGGTLILWQNNALRVTIPTNQRGVTFDATGTTLITSGFSSLKRFRLDQLLQNQPVLLWQQTFEDGATFSVAISPPGEENCNWRLVCQRDCWVLQINGMAQMKMTYAEVEGFLEQRALRPAG